MMCASDFLSYTYINNMCTSFFFIRYTSFLLGGSMLFSRARQSRFSRAKIECIISSIYIYMYWHMRRAHDRGNRKHTCLYWKSILFFARLILNNAVSETCAERCAISPCVFKFNRRRAKMQARAYATAASFFNLRAM